jgi:hypothetical protein
MAARRPRYGTLATIKRDQFVVEVTEASRECWVVVLLYQEKCALLSLTSCDHVFRNVSFVSISCLSET